MKRPEFIFHYSEIQEDDHSHYPGSRERLSIASSFSRKLGFQRIGIHHELLPPGRRTSWPHAHSQDEEFAFVLEGEPDVWIDGELYRLRPGDGVGFTPGTGISHTFINNTLSDVRLLVVGDSGLKDDKGHYPLHPVRREQLGERYWTEAPAKKLGSHDGMPDAQR